jgi:H+/gluconate symporter-like permease
MTPREVNRAKNGKLVLPTPNPIAKASATHANVYRILVFA